MELEWEEEIGRGLYAHCWLARDIVIGRPVAVKFVDEDSTAEALLSARMHASPLARVQHPGVVQVYSVEPQLHPDSKKPRVAVLMEYVPGDSLNKLTRSLSLEEALRAVDQVAAGLQAVHDAELVHGDLHEGNVVVSDGQTKLIDLLYLRSLASASSESQQADRESDIRGLAKVCRALAEKASGVDQKLLAEAYYKSSQEKSASAVPKHFYALIGGERVHSENAQNDPSAPTVLAETDGSSQRKHGQDQTAPTDWSAASRSLLEWPRTLKAGYWIERRELQSLNALVSSGASGPIGVLGPPGCGKSSLLGAFAAEQLANGRRVFALKSEQLPNTVCKRDDICRALDLEGDPLKDLLSEAAPRESLLILDQLDALCDLLDLKTQRLDVLLRLIADANSAGVQVVFSSRDFEFDHDARFRRLDPTRLDLSLPEPEAVDTFLRHLGHEPKKLPANLRELCRNLETLRLFSEMEIPSTEFQSLTTQQALVERLWSRHVSKLKGDPTPGEVALQIASQMGEQEEYVVGLAQFDPVREQIEKLVGVGLLRLERGETVSFRHQTMFEFCRARAFIARQESLTNHVRKHQDALFVRPVLWGTLTYLRAASPSAYEREVRTLSTADFRKHIQLLVAQFLGSVPQPNDFEVRLVVDVLQEGSRKRMYLTAIAQNSAWFDRLPSPMLQALLREEWALAAWWLQTSVSQFPDRVAAELEKHCLPDPKRHSSGLSVLSCATDWTADLAKVACRLTSLGHAEFSAVSHLLWQLKRHHPRAAIEVFSAFVQRSFGDLQKKLSTETAADGNGVQELISLWSGFHCLVDLAKASPDEFCSVALAPYVRLAVLAGKDDAPCHRYRSASILDLLPDRHGNRDFCTALETALVSLAKTSPDRFQEIVLPFSSEDSMEVHVMICAGLRVLAASRPESVVGYLNNDPRRWRIRTFQQEDGISLRLLKALRGALNRELAASLESTILESPPDYTSHEDASLRKLGLEWSRRRRLRQLSTIDEVLLSGEGRRLKNELSAAFPDETLEAKSNEDAFSFGEIGSPMSAKQMGLASDEAILRLFDRLSDETEWRHPDRWMEGGSIQASREFEKFAESSPKRAFGVLRLFSPRHHERPAGHGFLGLVSSGYSPADIQSLATELDSKGFRSAEFREDVARALEKLTLKHAPLESNTRKMLLRWLDADWPVEDHEKNADESEREGSILWGYGGGGILPHAQYPILECLRVDLLARKPPEQVEWLALLESQESKGLSDEVWTATAHYFDWLPRNQRAAEFLDRLFTAHPNVLRSVSGARTVARAASWTSSKMVEKWIRSLRGTGFGDQVYGELVGFFGTRQKPTSLLSEDLKALSSGATNNLEVVGLCHALGHLWHEQNHRELVTFHMISLIPRLSGAAADALAYSLQRESVLADLSSRSVASALVAAPEICLTRRGWGGEFIRELAAIEATLAADLLDAVVKVLARDNVSPGMGEELVDAALTLQRRTETRSRGLDLFEALLELGVYGTRQALKQLDGLA